MKSQIIMASHSMVDILRLKIINTTQNTSKKLEIFSREVEDGWMLRIRLKETGLSF